MSTQSFFSIPREKLLEFRHEIIANSDAQYKAALITATAGQYGTAIPPLLASTEELIKALVIVLDSKGFRFRETKGMDVFFKHHEVRFFISYFMFALSLFADDIIKQLEFLKTNPDFIKNIIEDKEQRDIKTKWYVLRKFLLLKKEIKWFSDAQYLRQNSFYVDMKETLTTPAQITKEQFEDARLRVERANKVTKYFIEAFLDSDAQTVQQIESLKTKFRRVNFYQVLEQGLQKIRKDRTPFFALFESGIFADLYNREERKNLKAFVELASKKPITK